MTESAGPISSAVILPKSEEPKSPPTKRRQSSASDHASKRPKISQEEGAQSPNPLHSSPAAIESPRRESSAKQESVPKSQDTNQARRKSSVVEERKRGQRLFGGLLSTLSQSTPNGQQKRRLEIEKRQAERVKQQKLDDEARRKEKLAKLKEVRMVEQVKFDEQSMRIRHENMRAMANFLCTKAKPKIYYKPWELLPAEEERIKTQIAEVEEITEREVEEFYIRNPKPAEVAPEEEKTNTSKETVGEPQVESPSVSKVLVDSTNNPVQAPQSEQVTAEKDPPEEHNGEVVVEAEEDTVIY